VIVDQEYWETGYQELQLQPACAADELVKFLDCFIGLGHGKTCLEVGCYPGRYLHFLGSKGYDVSGIDRTPHVHTRLVPWLQANNMSLGTFIVGDFETERLSERFDLVCSFGFIEHFRNFDEVIGRHASLLKPGGRLIVTAPNFAGLFQRLLHKCLDAENLARHHLAAMNPSKWRRQLEKLGMSVEFDGYFGVFDFWTDNPDASRLQSRLTWEVVKRRDLVRRCVKRSYRCLAPHCGIVARLQG